MVTRCRVRRSPQVLTYKLLCVCGSTLTPLMAGLSVSPPGGKVLLPTLSWQFPNQRPALAGLPRYAAASNAHGTELLFIGNRMAHP